MQVEEDYNPTNNMSAKEAKLQYLQRLRKREAEEFRLKYLGAKAAPADHNNRNNNINEIRQTVAVQGDKNKLAKQKPVKYVFQELGHPENPAGDKEGGAGGDSLSDILHQKEKIRSLITPDPDRKEQEMLNIGSRQEVVANAIGRSPYCGAQLKVVSVNHRKQKNDPIFENKCNELDDKSQSNMAPIPEGL